MKHAMKQSVLLLPALVVVAAGCSSQRQSAPQAGATPAPAPPLATVVAPPDRGGTIRSQERIGESAVSMMPKGQVYRMSGDYARNVAITLAADGTVQSYPAPTDITPSSAPVELDGGWWLDRRGVTDRSVFTRYTLQEYAALKEAPTPAELLAAVIPGARVTAVMKLPVTTREALADTAAVNSYIATHALGAKVP